MAYLAKQYPAFQNAQAVEDAQLIAAAYVRHVGYAGPGGLDPQGDVNGNVDLIPIDSGYHQLGPSVLTVPYLSWLVLLPGGTYEVVDLNTDPGWQVL